MELANRTDEAESGGGNFDGVAMCEHEFGVGEGVEEGVEGEDMAFTDNGVMLTDNVNVIITTTMKR